MLHHSEFIVDDALAKANEVFVCLVSFCAPRSRQFVEFVSTGPRPSRAQRARPTRMVRTVDEVFSKPELLRAGRRYLC